MKKFLVLAFLLFSLPAFGQSILRTVPEVKTTFDTTGIVGNVTTADSLWETTVGATWSNGSEVDVYFILNVNADTGAHGYLRSQLVVNGQAYTVDSSNGFAGNGYESYYLLRFIRVGDSIKFTPDMSYFAGSASVANMYQAAKANFGYNYHVPFAYSSGHTDGNVFAGIAFGSKITIALLTNWVTAPTGSANTKVRVEAAGAQYSDWN